MFLVNSALKQAKLYVFGKQCIETLLAASPFSDLFLFAKRK